jgi:hypothetical protein
MTDSTTDSMSKQPEPVDTTNGNGKHIDSPHNHKQHELPRQFSLVSTLAFGFSMTNSWLRYSATFITPLLLGGSPTVFFGLIAASIASCFISRGAVSISHHENLLTLFSGRLGRACVGLPLQRRTVSFCLYGHTSKASRSGGFYPWMVEHSGMGSHQCLYCPSLW